MGVGAAIIGSALLGAGSTVYANKEAEKAAEEATREQQRLLEQQEATRLAEEAYKSDVQGDTETLLNGEPLKTADKNTTVDFSKSIKTSTDDEVDKLTKSFQSYVK